MKLKNLLLIFIVLVFTSCNTKKLSKSSVPVDKDPIQFNSRISLKETSPVACYESDEFVSNALADYTIATISKKYTFLKCSKELVVNIHDTSIIDTIYTFSNHENRIQIYRSKQKDLLFLFDVKDSRITLSGNVKLGITKDLFLRKFKIYKPIGDKVQIASSDGTMKFVFYFEKNRLTRVKSDLYLD